MKKLLCIIVICIGGLTQAQYSFSSLDTLITQLDEKQLIWGEVQVQQNGKSIYKRNFGKHQIDQGEPYVINKPIYRVGSISKTFTAVLFLQLLEEGKISLDQKLSDFYPQFPQSDSISMKMLLQHRSGLYNYTNAEDFYSYVYQGNEKESFIKQLAQYELGFSPGKKYEYSNSNYIVLTFIIEKVSGKDYSELLQQNILDQLQMTDTYYKSSTTQRECVSFMSENDSLVEVPKWNLDWALGAGALLSTTTDLLKFIQALFQEKLINQNSLDLMLDLKDNYGLGILSFPFADKTFYGHTGGLENFRALVSYHPESQTAYARTINMDNTQNFSLNDLDISVLAASFGVDYEPPKLTYSFEAKAIEEDILQQYVGIYSNPTFPLKIEIFVQDGQLMGQATGQGSFPLTAESETIFHFNPAKIQLTFFEENNKQKFHYSQYGNELVFVRED